MNSEEFKNYLTDRYENQIDWYSKKASNYKKYYKNFQWNVIILSVSLPVLISVLE